MMANHKWTKWIVGLSGAVLFSGFVGYISNHDTASATSGTTNSSQFNNDDLNSLQDQFDSQSGSSSDDQGGSSTFGRGFGRHGGQDFSGGDTGQSGSESDGGMRTHAS